MSEEQIRDRLSYILPGEELGRVKYLKIMNNDILHITLDVHKWSRDKVASVLRKIVALEREPLRISVIHGYIHGTKIKKCSVQIFVMNEWYTGEDITKIPE